MILLTISFDGFTQFQPYLFNLLGKTQPQIKAIGIGDFSWSNRPKAALNINANLLPNPFFNDFQVGQVFRTDGPSGNDNMWQMFTGTGGNATEKGRFYVPANEIDLVLQATQRDMIFNAGGDIERMRIIGSDFTNLNGVAVRAGNVGIDASFPITRLHIGKDLSHQIGQFNGARDWMDVGTFYFDETDNMYVGLKREGVDKCDAIINWGDNMMGSNLGPDNLRFIFTTEIASGSIPGSNNGVEIARMTYNYGVPRMGISESSPEARLHINTGNFGGPMIPGLDEKLQLRIADGTGFTNFRAYNNGDLLINPIKSAPSGDEKRDAGIGITNPNHPNAKLEILRDDYQQLRLTHTYNQQFTDFYTTEDGDLLINPTNFQIGINLNPGDPTQAIDAKGNARLRTLPSAPFENTNPDKIVCVDADGTLNWTDASNFGGGGADADWFDQNNIGNTPTSIDDNIYTFNEVCLGSSSSYSSMMYIENSVNAVHNQQNQKHGLFVNTKIDNNGLYPVNAPIYGIYSEVSDINQNSNKYYKHAVFAKTYCDDWENGSSGVHGEIIGGGKNSAIYGKVYSSDNWAGYFEGNVQIHGNLNVSGTYPTSDYNLKTNIVQITNAIDILNQLYPKKFNFKVSDYPRLSLPSGIQYGLIAQDVENILPTLIKENTLMAEYDSLGNIVSPELTYKGLNYDAFIPFLVKGIQELDSINTNLGNRVDSLENVLNSYQSQFAMLDSLMNIVSNMNMASNPNTQQNDMVENFEVTYKEYVEDNNTVLYQNNPNPFTEETEFSYSLAEAGNVLFEIHNEQGKLIQVLADELQNEGKHIIHWDSNNLETGVYIYSLKFNGDILVKKAIKIK